MDASVGTVRLTLPAGARELLCNPGPYARLSLTLDTSGGDFMLDCVEATAWVAGTSRREAPCIVSWPDGDGLWTPPRRRRHDVTLVRRGPGAAWDVTLQGTALARDGEIRVWGIVRGVTADTGTAAVRVVRGRTIRGRVVDADGAPVRSAGVELSRCSLSGWTDSEGAFVIDGAPPWAVEVSAATSDGCVRTPDPSVVPAGGDVDVVVHARVEPRSSSPCVTGRLLMEDGTPAAGRVRLVVGAYDGRNGFPDAEGRFVIYDVPPGPHRVMWAWGEVEILDLGEVTAPASDVVLTARLP